jgi:hypothetical protein
MAKEKKSQSAGVWEAGRGIKNDWLPKISLEKEDYIRPDSKLREVYWP